MHFERAHKSYVGGDSSLMPEGRKPSKKQALKNTNSKKKAHFLHRHDIFSDADNFSTLLKNSVLIYERQ